MTNLRGTNNDCGDDGYGPNDDNDGNEEYVSDQMLLPLRCKLVLLQRFVPEVPARLLHLLILRIN